MVSSDAKGPDLVRHRGRGHWRGPLDPEGRPAGPASRPGRKDRVRPAGPALSLKRNRPALT